MYHFARSRCASSTIRGTISSNAEKLVADVFASSLSNYINGEINLARFIRNLDIRLRDERLELLRTLEAYRETIQ